MKSLGPDVLSKVVNTRNQKLHKWKVASTEDEGRELLFNGVSGYPYGQYKMVAVYVSDWL